MTFAEAFQRLSPREQDVARRLARGLQRREIAAELGIGVKTCSTYRERAFAKLGVRTAAELASRVVLGGIE